VFALAVAVALVVSACASPRPHTPANEARLEGQERAQRHDPADLELVFQPAIGVFGVAQFRQGTDDWEVAVLRNVRRGKAATWAIAYQGAAASKLGRAVDQVKRAAPIAKTCPPATGRDGATWLVSVPEIPDTSSSWELAYPAGGSPECQLLAQQLHDLMLMAHLDCEGRLCLRPEERLSGTWACAEGTAGTECRAADRNIGR